MGIAAPVPLPSRGLVGSLSLVLDAAATDSAPERRLAMLVVSTASLLTEAVAAAQPAPCIRLAG